MDTLLLDNLPSLPQIEVLRQSAEKIWQQEGVIALWLGGSFARGTADKYSDIDLRVCVSVETRTNWEQPDFDLFEGDAVGRRYYRFGPIQLHQIVLANGIILDLTLQSIDQKPQPDFVYLLGCRDEEFRRHLISIEPEETYNPKPADNAVISQILTDFWIDSLKTPKVLYRNLDAIAMIGIELERAVLMRLWYVLATGTDAGIQRPTIHGLTVIVRHISSSLGNSAQELLGLPLRNRDELYYAIEANRNEVARVGKILSERLDFAYPLRLENTVREAWDNFLALSGSALKRRNVNSQPTRAAWQANKSSA